ncbi:MAG: anti-sigma factor [Candidatus Dadabacteria bacterium]|jgi:anti-sigma factor RsiW
MDCKNIKELLTQYSLGDLGHVEKASVESHLDSCSECKSYLFETKNLWNLLEARDEIEPDTEFLSNFWDKAAVDEVKLKPGFLRWFRDIKPNWTLAGAMASIFLVSIITFGALSPDTRNSFFMSSDEQDELILIELDNALSRETADVLSIYGAWDGGTDVDGGID